MKCQETLTKVNKLLVWGPPKAGSCRHDCQCSSMDCFSMVIIIINWANFHISIIMSNSGYVISSNCNMILQISCHNTKRKPPCIGGMELVSLSCNRVFISAESVGRGWCKIAIATKWYQFHTTDKCGFLFMPWITDQLYICAIHKTSK